MSVNHALLALFAAIVAFLSVHLVLSTGVDSDIARLESYRSALEENVAALEALNTELSANAELYEHDARAISVVARELVYYGANERVIRTPGRDPAVRALSPGAVLREQRREHDHRVVSALAAIVVFLLVFFVLVLLEQQSTDSQTTRRASR